MKKRKKKENKKGESHVMKGTQVTKHSKYPWQKAQMKSLFPEYLTIPYKKHI